ncbi:Mucin-associated surface protein (MASP) [Trypanosoma cruzi]|uniref:Mucin-associated surface protein (MASP), putative n=2 Tax=Trypanosoma cruzi TaxID=5693 RepID=Q4E102_TRYCC|nr:mucin-associated surface protein (MASP), putative [Trypanosoma cruzi]EAN98453.1 mucin-associated surface protein (MASP), putative [Trypanosoma cruzi]PWV12270.1 Mucin-associated surface protein (MASP) [Trypanosoma cruzi]|eukprot:XP_820304.1 mucin-associated surface protein (MASP) [Trypanosoma cruzi strain CL Brener]
MAMMMTGRVLLVCAVCVLWCGLSGIATDGVGGGDGSADEDLLLQWRAWLRRECAEEVSRRTGGRENASVVEECVHQGMDGVRAVVDGRRRWRRQRIVVAAAAAGNGDVSTDKDGQARNKEVSPPEIKDEKPVASGQESTDATRGKDQTTQNTSAAIVSLKKLISGKKKQEEGERMTEKEDGDNEDEEVEDEAKIRETTPVVPPPTAAAGGGIKPPSGASGPAAPGAILTSRSSSGVDSSSRIGDEGSTVGISPNAVGKPSRQDKVPEAEESQHAQRHDGVAADTLNNGPEQNGSAPTTGQNENEVATLGAGGSRSSREQITVKGGSEASRTDESSADPNTKLQENEKTPLKPSQAAATEPKTQHEVLTSVKEETKSKSTDASANLPDAPKSSEEHPASAATTMQSTSTGSQEAAATPSSNRISSLHEETTTGNNITENAQPPKETPVEGTAMKTTTATTGDSDGSTAASHTTSPPLLLLLVVASAAAAAVVAA